FEFSREDSREKAPEAGLDANFFFQARVQKHQFASRLSGQRLQHRAREKLERHHGRDWISRQAEEVGSRRFADDGTRATPAEDDRASGLNFCAGEEELGL